PKAFQLHTAVRLTASTSDTLATRQIRLDSAPRTLFDTMRIVSHGNDIDAELMSEPARIAEKWLFTAVGVQVRAANADPFDLHQGFARAWIGRIDSFAALELSWLLKNNLFHVC